MFKFSAKLLVADHWDGIDTKIHLQDQNTWAKRVWNGLRQQFGALNQQYKIKGVVLQDWIREYGISELLKSQDPVVRKATNDIRQLLRETVTTTQEGGQFRQNEVQAFKQQFGSNVTDWLFELVGQKRAKSLKVTSSLLER